MFLICGAGPHFREGARLILIFNEGASGADLAGSSKSSTEIFKAVLVAANMHARTLKAEVDQFPRFSCFSHVVCHEVVHFVQILVCARENFEC